MADIELVIKIPEEQKKMVDAIIELPPQVENDLISAIRHGTPLPKGHGDLIDRADILQDVYSIDDWSGDEVDIVDLKLILNADPVVEADR